MDFKGHLDLFYRLKLGIGTSILSRKDAMHKL
jgi:hypothetical protein